MGRAVPFGVLGFERLHGTLPLPGRCPWQARRKDWVNLLTSRLASPVCPLVAVPPGTLSDKRRMPLSPPPQHVGAHSPSPESRARPREGAGPGLASGFAGSQPQPRRLRALTARGYLRDTSVPVLPGLLSALRGLFVTWKPASWNRVWSPLHCLRC